LVLTKDKVDSVLTTSKQQHTLDGQKEGHLVHKEDLFLVSSKVLI